VAGNYSAANGSRRLTIYGCGWTGVAICCAVGLTERLAWCEAGERIEILWTAEVLLFRSMGIDEEVRREETRLADRDALTELRGGLGESYHRALTAILQDMRDGLPFRDLVAALRE
jgi:hypothetical protein